MEKEKEIKKKTKKKTKPKNRKDRMKTWKRQKKGIIKDRKK